MVSGFAPGPSATRPALEKLNCCTKSRLEFRLSAVYCRQEHNQSAGAHLDMSSTKQLDLLH